MSLALNNWAQINILLISPGKPLLWLSLMLKMLAKSFSRRHFEIFSSIPQKKVLIFHANCHSPFLGKTKKNISLSSAEIDQIVVKVKLLAKVHPSIPDMLLACLFHY